MGHKELKKQAQDLIVEIDGVPKKCTALNIPWDTVKAIIHKYPKNHTE